MPLQACILLLLVSTTQAFLQTTRLHRQKPHSLINLYSRQRKISQYAAYVAGLGSSYRDQEIRRKWETLQHHLSGIYSGKFLANAEKNQHGKIVTKFDRELNSQDPDISPIRPYDEHNRKTKSFRYQGTPKVNKNSRKSNSQPRHKLNKEDVLPRQQPNIQPFVPPPGNPEQLPAPPFAWPPSATHADAGRTQKQILPRSTDGVFNRPTTHLLNTHPTWSSGGYQELETDINQDRNPLIFENNPTSSLTEPQNIPTRPSSNTRSDQATGFPTNYWQPPPEVRVRIQSPDTSLDWSLPAPPYFTCNTLLGDLVSLRTSGMPIRLELGADTTETEETCVYLKQMLVHASGEQLEWVISITDRVGKVVWKSKCVPGSTFTIWPGYRVVFNGIPITTEKRPLQKVLDYETGITEEPASHVETHNDMDNFENVVPGPRHIQKQNWVSNNERVSLGDWNTESDIYTTKNGR